MSHERSLDQFFRNLAHWLEVHSVAQQRLERALATRFNVFDYISPDENQLSDLFADLLDPDGTHGQGREFLGAFLEELELDSRSPGQLRWIRREVPTRRLSEGRHRRRLDLLLRFDGLLLGIENKPWADEQREQVADYLEFLEKEADRFHLKGRHVLIFLSADGDESQISSLSPDKREMHRDRGELQAGSYADEIARWLKNCGYRCEAQRVQDFLEQFHDFVTDEFGWELVDDK